MAAISTTSSLWPKTAWSRTSSGPGLGHGEAGLLDCLPPLLDGLLAELDCQRSRKTGHDRSG
jgi:hypothetical protein